MTRRILIANVTLGGCTGTEVVTRDLAVGLASRGHQVSVFAGTPGPFADQLRAAGVPVVSRLEDVGEPPEIVHGHHYLETVAALLWFPQAAGVFVCHDRTAPHSIPPRLERIRRYVAVDLNCLERLRDDWHIPAVDTRVILNAVDTARFRQRGPLPPAPARALVFSHYASPATHVDLVREACARIGVAVDVIGSAFGTAVAEPETRLGQYDLVFAKGRCALEAIAVGAAVVLCDATGLGPMVTMAELPALRAWNFGARVLGESLERDALVRAIRRYDPSDAAAVSSVIRSEASLESALDQYEAVYADVMADAPSPTPAEDRLQELIAPLLARVAGLESDVAAYRRPDRMLALSDAAVSALHVSLVSAPATLTPGARGFAYVRLRNDVSGQALSTAPPFPLQWACRWQREGAIGFIDATDIRTPIRRPVPPGGADEFAVAVVAPAAPGRYVLRITLVQEGLRWLDDTATPVCLDVTVAVGGAAPAAR